MCEIDNSENCWKLLRGSIPKQNILNDINGNGLKS